MTKHQQLREEDTREQEQEEGRRRDEDDNQRTKELPPQTDKNKNNVFGRKFIAMAIGNFMEWFDFSVFGALIDIISDHFFPTEAEELRFLKTVAIFGAGFAMRPLGGMLVGWIGDTIGRKLALEISIVMMLFPSFLIGCLPTYNDIGWWAPAGLMLLRLIQGLAAGGEMVGAFIFTLESTEGKHVGFWGGACKATGNLGSSTGIGLAALLRLTLNHNDLHQWGWRIPFLMGIVFGLVGWLARRSLGNIKDHTPSDHSQYFTILKTLFHEHLSDIAIVVFTAAFWGCGYYTCFVWLAYYLQDPHLIGGNEGLSDSWGLCFAANLTLVIALPLGGLCGDYVSYYVRYPGRGHKVMLQLATVLMIASVLPAFLLFRTKLIACATIAYCLLIVPIGLFGGNLPIFMISHFEQSLRFSGVGIAYNVSHALFTSTVAVVQTSLILVASHGMKHHKYIEDHVAIASPHLLPAYYLIFISLITFMTLQLDNSEPHPILSNEEEEERNTVVVATALTEDKLPSTAPPDSSIHNYGPTQPLLQARP